MANFRRNKPRLRTSRGYSRRTGRERFKKHHPWMCWWPAWWDILHHSRPQRRRDMRCEKAVLNGADPDNIVWPLSRKPHQYYW